MPKRKLSVFLESNAKWFYRRQGIQTIYVRDMQGCYDCFRIANDRAYKLPGGIKNLGPVFGRVDFRNTRRFTAYSRSQETLNAEFMATPPAQRLSTGWRQLPLTRDRSRRVSNQGMDTAMNNLTGQTYSATNYATWCKSRHPALGINNNVRWEWCHLLAHSMGGADNETNIVAAVKGNNTEQLAIETALQMYRCESIFELQVTAARLNNPDCIYIGNIIKYEVRCRFGGGNFVHYMDCLGVPNPSQIHFYDLLEKVAVWANNKLNQVSKEVHRNVVTTTHRHMIEVLN